MNLQDYRKAEKALHDAAVAFDATSDDDPPSIREARRHLEQAAENYSEAVRAFGKGVHPEGRRCLHGCETCMPSAPEVKENP